MDWNGLERIYKKHEVLDYSFEILEWWWSRWCVDCYSLRVKCGIMMMMMMVVGGAMEVFLYSPIDINTAKF